jgi:hypothetical protein
MPQLLSSLHSKLRRDVELTLHTVMDVEYEFSAGRPLLEESLRRTGGLASSAIASGAYVTLVSIEESATLL